MKLEAAVISVHFFMWHINDSLKYGGKSFICAQGVWTLAHKVY